MAYLLYIEASPRKQRSHSIDIAHAFIDAYKETHPGDTVETLDLWGKSLPEFDGDALNAKYAVLHGEEHTPEQAAAWEAIKFMATPLLTTDKLLFSLPMWNFGIPYKLKHYIDVITQPGLTFTQNADGSYEGLVSNKPCAVVYARGGSYGPGSPAAGYDHQTTYFEQWLGFIGITDVKTLLVEPTLTSRDDLIAMKARVAEEARTLAREF